MGVRASKLTKIIGVSKLKSFRETPLTPKGYIPVSVGVNMNESKRFMIHTKSLRDKDFVEFLCKSAEEYGFYNDGILKIPYEAEAFEEWFCVQGAKHNVLRVD
ncbi:hypothetical protein Vadar_019154 [Vaccinium darrowii]|uniref:Uncharacterized protein n=1 Tax=Vaccinium darrowii TaxID=229202 RepID=A0ACB7YXK7_9ERIC|nr:hypothetical protein Vadar_019154 [Vaccinium darrowii]